MTLYSWISRKFWFFLIFCKSSAFFYVPPMSMITAVMPQLKPKFWTNSNMYYSKYFNPRTCDTSMNSSKLFSSWLNWHSNSAKSMTFRWSWLLASMPYSLIDGNHSRWQSHTKGFPCKRIWGTCICCTVKEKCWYILITVQC